MRIQIVNFNLKGLGQKAYGELCAGLAPALSDVPGLISKVWISDPETNTYGGVYLWQSAEAMAAFGESDLFAQIKANPHFTHLTWRDFGILENPTQVTRGIHTIAGRT